MKTIIFVIQNQTLSCVLNLTQDHLVVVIGVYYLILQGFYHTRKFNQLCIG